MALSIYLYFDGNCGQAFEHYQAVLGAQWVCRQPYSDAPAGTFSDRSSERIMHATIKIGGSILMGSDRASDSEEPVILGNNFAVTFEPPTKAEADRMFAQLAAEGEITMPLQETFWKAYFGLCTDRFGIHWMFNMPLDS